VEQRQPAVEELEDEEKEEEEEDRMHV